MTYTYLDYTPAFEAVIDSWLDKDAAYYTGIEDGFAAYHDYWMNEPTIVFGKNHWVKMICKDDQPIGVIVLGVADGIFNFSEFLIDPARRGNGIGTVVIAELLHHGSDILGQEIRRAEACIFPSNLPSQHAFAKAGFQLDPASPDGDRWYYEA